MHICVIAGEPSGDFLGGQLIKALKEQRADIAVTGVGGPHMMDAGLQSLFAYEDLAVMGIAEVAPKIPLLLKRIHQTADHIMNAKPDVVVSIDSPDFCFRVIKAVKKKGGVVPKFVHYVAPTVWAWRAGRAKKLAGLVDGLICLFDFEPAYFEKEGLKSFSAGHPMVESGAMKAQTAAFRDEYGITQGEECIGVLFGSRRGEIKNTAPVLRDALYQMLGQMGDSVLPHIIVPTLPHIKSEVLKLLKDCPAPIHIVTDKQDKWGAFKTMRVAMAVSGTVGLELAAMQIPHVIAYKTNFITAEIVRRMVKVKYAHLANIMADKEVVPEFLQENCVPDKIATATHALFRDSKIQRHDFANITQRLGYGQSKTPSQKAAAFVLSFVS